MDRAGGIVELLADYSQVRRQIRTYSLQDAEKLFNTLMLQTFFIRRMESDPAFRWSICNAIYSDEEERKLLCHAIIGAIERADDDQEDPISWIRKLAANPDTICSLFAGETGLPVHFWRKKSMGILYQQFAYPTAFQTQTPEMPLIPHPMDRAIIVQCAHPYDTRRIFTTSEECLITRTACRQAITDCAQRWFLKLPEEEGYRILNSQHPSEGWDALMQTLNYDLQSTEALIENARYCVLTHQIKATRALYLYACNKTDDPYQQAICSLEMGYLSRNLGEYDRAFGEFQYAIEMEKKARNELFGTHDDIDEHMKRRTVSSELIYLCEAAEQLSLSEEPGSCFDRLIQLAQTTGGGERTRILLQIAASCRRCGWFEREYALLEELIDTGDDAVLYRLNLLTRSMRPDGSLDSDLLSNLEAQAEGEYTLMRGILAFGAFRFDDALAWCNRSVSVNSTPETRLWYARSALYAREPLLQEERKKNDLLETRIIHRLLQTQSVDAGIQELIVHGNSDEVYDGLLLLLEGVREKELTDWIAEFIQSISKAQIPQEHKTHLIRTLGKVLSECGVPDAVFVLRKALKTTTLKESRAEILSEIGYWHEIHGQVDKARDTYKRAVSVYQKFPGGWHGLARSHALNGEYDAAMEAIETAIQYMPERNDLRIFRNLLADREETSDLDQAVRDTIDSVDRTLFQWGEKVPLSFARRYQHLLFDHENDIPILGNSEVLPVMIVAEEAMQMRNDVIRNLRQRNR
ncbi:MAG: hypothetical protein D5R96_02395 [Methanocalculus sp. MSAO_Arc2]|uniref:tetratricopeptide repeat protein n=1 Tax=Methanocalculus sp. MSAO_Arc2 TaxID=2293855 RepID=UPI000FF56534|nr:MAG: hypothetical protein D5R96_02395 [Methanocalculus sp. MSAO_Arc2]